MSRGSFLCFLWRLGLRFVLPLMHASHAHLSPTLCLRRCFTDLASSCRSLRNGRSSSSSPDSINSGSGSRPSASSPSLSFSSGSSMDSLASPSESATLSAEPPALVLSSVSASNVLPSATLDAPLRRAGLGTKVSWMAQRPFRVGLIPVTDAISSSVRYFSCAPPLHMKGQSPLTSSGITRLRGVTKHGLRPFSHMKE